MNILEHFIQRENHRRYIYAYPSFVNTLCRQGAKLLSAQKLPQRVKELVLKYPYMTALAAAQGMWVIMEYTREELPLHDDRILFNGHNAFREILIDFSLEPIPVGAYYQYSGYDLELEFITAAGMIYEDDFVNESRNFERRYKQLLLEYSKVDKNERPMYEGLTITTADVEILKDLIKHESALFCYSNKRYIPELVQERHSIMQELIKKLHKDEDTSNNSLDRNSKIYKMGNKWYANLYSPMVGSTIVGSESQITDEMEFDSFENCGVNDGMITATKIITKANKYALFIFETFLSQTIGTYICHDSDPFIYDDIRVLGDWNNWVDYGYVLCRQCDRWNVIKVTQFPMPKYEVIQKGVKSFTDALKIIGLKGLDGFSWSGNLELTKYDG